MANIRQLGAGAGILAGVAAAWVFIGLVVVFPSAGLSLSAHANPHAVIPFLTKHQVMYWLVNVLGGFLSAIMMLVLFLALGDRFRDEAPAPSQIGVAAGIVGVIGFGIGSLLNQIGFGSLIPLYAANKIVAATAWYGVKGTADAFMTLGGVAVGISALVFGNVMLKTNKYAPIGYLSVVAGTPLILSGFISHVLLFMLVSLLTIAWLSWTGITMWSETVQAHAGQPQRHVPQRGRQGELVA